MLVRPGLTRSVGVRPVLDLNLLAGALDSRISFTRASTATYFDRNGVMQTAAAGVPRFDYDPVTLQPRGLLIEEQRTNLLKYSSDFSQAAAWGSACIVTQNAATAPDGTNTAQLVSDANAAGFPALFQNASVANDSNAYAFSIFYKAGTTRTISPRVYFSGGTTPVTMACNIDPVTDAVTSSSFISTKIDVLPNGWRRVSCICSNNGTGNTTVQPQIFPDGGVASGTGAVYLWGAQLEAGAFPTSYIPTTTAAATRSADVASMALSSIPGWSASEGTVVVEADAANYANYKMVYGFTDGSGINNQLSTFIYNGDSVTTDVWVSGVPQAGLAMSMPVSAGTIFRHAMAFQSNSFASVTNGGPVVSDASGTIPPLTKIDIGNRLGSYPLNGHIRRLRLFNRRLSNTQLQGLTA